MSLYTSPEYTSYRAMKYRCYGKNFWAYHNYGGRGIKVCDRWLGRGIGFKNFLEDMGPRPSGNYSLERIDNDGDYTPGNCRWATQLEQCNNLRRNRRYTINGVTHTQAEWLRLYKVPTHQIYNRMKNGHSFEYALTTPLLRRSKYDKA